MGRLEPNLAKSRNIRYRTHPHYSQHRLSIRWRLRKGPAASPFKPKEPTKAVCAAAVRAQRTSKNKRRLDNTLLHQRKSKRTSEVSVSLYIACVVY
jgi:hypothetical protein